MTERTTLSRIPFRIIGSMDFFSDSHQNTEPLLLKDGTSVVFSVGWTDEDADKWRKSKELQKPNPDCASDWFH